MAQFTDDGVQMPANAPANFGKDRIKAWSRTYCGPVIEDAGKYITIYQKHPDDTWKMARDIWNSSHPLPA